MSPAFPITLRFRGGLSSSQKDAFTAAASRWQRAIVAPLPTVSFGGVVTAGCIIDAQGVTIDGPNGILGQAGPVLVRPGTMGPASFLPCLGAMSFDSADLAAMEHEGSLVDVITHEMGHVLGIGTEWSRKMKMHGYGSANPTFLGSAAVREYSRLRATSAQTQVPVENMGGAGTANSHWRERVFGSELMTGYISAPGAKNPLSALTILSLQDLGYVVNPLAADAYSLPSHLLAAEAPAPIPRRHCQSTIPFVSPA